MKLDILIECLRCGEEIEFSVDGNTFFFQPDFETRKERNTKDDEAYGRIILYDTSNYEEPQKIFSGSIKDVLNYKFKDKYTFWDDIEKFEFLYFV